MPEESREPRKKTKRQLADIEMAKEFQTTGDLEVRDRLLGRHEGFIRRMCEKYKSGDSVTHDDLYPIGVAGFFKGLSRFDPGRGFCLGTFCVHWIRQAILEYCNEVNDIIKISPVVKRLARKVEQNGGGQEEIDRVATTDEHKQSIMMAMSPMTSLDVAPCWEFDVYTEADADLEVEEKERAEIIHRVVDSLDPRERRIVTLYFGLDGEKPITLEDIGARIGVTRERTRQLKEKAMHRIRVRLIAEAQGKYQQTEMFASLQMV